MSGDLKGISEKLDELLLKKNKRGPRKAKKLPRHLSTAEVHKMFFLAENSSKRDLKVLKLLYYFGLRNIEMCNLEVRHVDVVRRRLKVVQGKGSKDRVVPILDLNWLPDEETTILKDLKKWIGRRRDGAIVEGESDGSISDRHVRRIVKKYAKIAKIRDWQEIHPHTLRHSCATHLRDLGVPLEIIQKLLGHAKTDTTLIYSHLSTKNLEEEILRAIWIGKARKEIPSKLAEINKIKDPIIRASKQQEIILQLLLINLGINPKT